MLIRSSLTGSIEAALAFVSDREKGDWKPDAETWHKRRKCEKNPQDGWEEVIPTMELKRNIDDTCSLNFAHSCSQLSTVSTMSENSTPAFVYRRRKLERNSISVFPVKGSAKPSDSFVGAPVMTLVNCRRDALVSKSESINGCLDGGELGSKAVPQGDSHRALDFGCVNDSYSSSKSNVELGSASLRIEVDDTGECSSSCELVVEGLQDDLSEKDICILILRRQGLLEGVCPIRSRTPAEGLGTISDSSCIRTCEVCDHPEITLKMLICDQCEEAFHLSCCNPRITNTLIDEWFCHSCLKKKHKILKETTTSTATSEGKLGAIASMLKDTGPCTHNVRIGQDFQVEVPDWSGSSVDEVDTIGEPSEIDSSECVSLHDWNSSKPCRLSSIGNWLQCREVIEGIGEGVDGTICGKWRRTQGCRTRSDKKFNPTPTNQQTKIQYTFLGAPLFEVQTDNWECFHAILWDPAHADCAVPQELDTDQVLKHLKYIEMLRPWLAAEKCKLDGAKNVGPRDFAKHVRNIQTL
ncbi:hypothetical protein LOK49_LG05G02228 [Camellia lanceoleosa]|uniref:Uncharacterized protein n=1 Tax=Camellia lanceoleosa TaxID=1840588 RepID=A0ACC0HT14_9ERIC|nr:hypothetical protein LOK49_LG05G02228 [Camellia lanceoleosa]